MTETRDIYNATQAAFEGTMAREQRDVYNERTGQVIHCFFRPFSDGASKEDKVILFTYTNEDIVSGDILNINFNQFIVINKESIENSIYQKFALLRCNYQLKIMQGIVNAGWWTIPCFLHELSTYVKSGDNMSTIESTIDASLPDNEVTRAAISIGKRMWVGDSQLPCQIRDYIYKNGFCEVSYVRDTISSLDDTEERIADRWKYEDRSVYTVNITNTETCLKKDSSAQVDIRITKDGEVITPTEGVSYWLGDTREKSISETGLLTIGANAPTGDFSVYVRYKNITTSRVWTVAETVVDAYSITPPYNTTWAGGANDTYFLRINSTQTFTANKHVNGEKVPCIWNFTLQANGISSTAYVFSKDETEGTFRVQSKKQVDDKRLSVNCVPEGLTEESIVYWIELGGLF